MKISGCKEGNIAFAEMSNEDIELVKAWLAKPHVGRWWTDSWSKEIFQDTAHGKNESFIDGSTIICIDDVPKDYLKCTLAHHRPRQDSAAASVD